MSDLTELLERVKTATGPDREIDWRIADATDHPSFEKRFEHMWPPFGPKSKMDKDIPEYTASIDAALALVERKLPGCMKRIFDNPDDGSCRAELVTAEGVSASGDHDTWPLAILAAMLSALASQEPYP